MGNGSFKHSALIGAIVAIGAASAASARCSAERVTILGDFGRAGFAVDVADDPQERAKGLMNVSSLPTMSGMLFVYETPQHATFWMRNTLIPLDMLFVGPNGVIQQIHENAVPMDDTTIDGGTDVLAVIEINGGLSRRLGIAVGDAVQHPTFGSDAVVRCE